MYKGDENPEFNRKELLRKILREDYGITTMRELDEAVRKQEKIDISIFCVKPRQEYSLSERSDNSSV